MEERRAGQSQVIDMLERIHQLQLDQATDSTLHAEKIRSLEKNADRQWWLQFVGPVMVLVHAGIRKMGVNL